MLKGIFDASHPAFILQLCLYLRIHDCKPHASNMLQRSEGYWEKVLLVLTLMHATILNETYPQSMGMWNKVAKQPAIGSQCIKLPLPSTYRTTMEAPRMEAAFTVQTAPAAQRHPAVNLSPWMQASERQARCIHQVSHLRVSPMAPVQTSARPGRDSQISPALSTRLCPHRPQFPW
jgi:hypothetical protein